MEMLKKIDFPIRVQGLLMFVRYGGENAGRELIREFERATDSQKAIIIMELLNQFPKKEHADMARFAFLEALKLTDRTDIDYDLFHFVADGTIKARLRELRGDIPLIERYVQTAASVNLDDQPKLKQLIDLILGVVR